MTAPSTVRPERNAAHEREKGRAMMKPASIMRSVRSVTLSLAVAGMAGFAPAAHAGQPRSYQRAQAAVAHGKLLDARLDLLNAVRRHPHDGAAHALLGEVSLQLGDAVSAEREARKAIAAGYQPNRSLALLLRSYVAQGRSIALLHDFPIGSATGVHAAVIAVGRARANLVLARFDRAEADLARAAGFAPDAPGLYETRIDLAIARHDLAAARRMIAARLKVTPTAPALLRREAQLDIGEGQPARAATILQRANAADPLNTRGKLLLIQAHLAAGALPAAQAELKRAASLLPHSAGLAYFQATIDVDEHHWHRASALLDHLGGIATQLPGILYLRARTDAALGQPAAALTAAQKFAAQQPGDSAAQLLVATLAVRSGHYGVASRSLDKLAAAGTLDAQALDLRTAIEIHDHKWNQAEQDALQALKADPKDLAAGINLAELAQQRGDFKAAEQRYRAVLAGVPASASAVLTSVEIRLGSAALLANDAPTVTQMVAALDKQGATPAAAQLQAKLDFRRGDLDAARADLTRLLAARPGSVTAQLGLARVDLLTQRPDAALKRLTAVVKAHPADPRPVLALAALQRTMNQPDAALATLDRAHDRAPDNVAFVAAILQQRLAAKQFTEAGNLVSTLPAAMQRQPQILLLRAKLDAAQGRLDQAALNLQSLLAATPDDVTSRLALAHIDMARKQPQAAEAVIEAGLARDPRQLALMQARVGLALARHGAGAAEQEAKRLAAAPDHMPEAGALEGDLALSLHHWAKAAAAFKAAYDANPSPALAAGAIRADIQGGHRDAALALLKAASARFPDSVALSDMRGSVALSRGDLKAAAAEYAHSLRLAPQDAVALNNLAWIEAKSGKPDAEALAERAYVGAPTPQTADTLGWILLHGTPGKARRARAAALLDAAHREDPADPSIAYHDAAALARTGERGKAIAILKPIVTPKASFADHAAAAALLAKLERQG